MNIDAFGKQCPLPLMLAKKEIDGGNSSFSISVDNLTAVKNLTRLGEKNGLTTEVSEREGGYCVFYSEGEVPSGAQKAAQQVAPTNEVLEGSGYAVFIGKDYVGEGDFELGNNLMKMALFTLAESPAAPVSLLFMNAGVKLLTGEEPQVIESVEALIEKGTEVLVCGTCLDYYHLKDELKIGEVSNMYDIVERMQEASKVITL